MFHHVEVFVCFYSKVVENLLEYLFVLPAGDDQSLDVGRTVEFKNDGGHLDRIGSGAADGK